MPQYRYKAVDITQRKFSGIHIAENETQLAVELSKQGLFLVSCKVYTGNTPSAFWTLGTGSVNMGELTTFCRQFAIMINTGVPILGCIELLKEQSFSSYFKSLLQIIYDDVKAGKMFSEALNKHKSVFPDFFRSMIKVGEVSGKLDTVMNSLADYYERDADIKRKTKSALAYPVMLACLTVAIVIVMLVFVMPTFRDTLDDIGIEVEGFTADLYLASDWLLANWTNLLLVIVSTILLLYLIGKTKKGRYFYDWLKINVPFIKSVNIGMCTARFARGFGLLLSSGMDITEALNSVLIVFGNKDMEARFAMAIDEVSHGMNLAIAFQKYKLFPDILNQMVSVGESTGQLDEVLSRSCNFFDTQVEETLLRVTSTLQPIMLLILGGIVGTLFIAIYSPMLSIMNGL